MLQTPELSYFVKLSVKCYTKFIPQQYPLYWLCEPEMAAAIKKKEWS